jgi:hypothetical protein
MISEMSCSKVGSKSTLWVPKVPACRVSLRDQRAVFGTRSWHISGRREPELHFITQSNYFINEECKFDRRSLHAMMVASLVATGLVEPAQALGCVFLHGVHGTYIVRKF